MTKITGLPAGVTADGTEKIAAVQGGVTVQLTLAQTAGASQPLDATLTSLASLDPFVIGDLLYANSTATLAKLPAVASGQPLVSGGVATASGYAGSWANFVVASKRLELRRSSNTFPVFGSTTTLFVQGADTGEGRIDVGACTSDAVIAFGRVDGTWGAPLIPAAGSQICGITGGTIHADGATTLQQGGYIGGYMRNKWSVSDHSWYWDFGTVAGGSTTLVKSVRFSDAGGLTVGPADVFPASGIINADTGYTVNSAAATSGNVLRGDGTKYIGAQLSPADLSVGAGSFTTVAYNSTLTGTTTSANALAVGRQGATNPALQVDASTALSVTGIKISGFGAGTGAGLSAISSATNEPLVIDSKGSGGLGLNAVSGTGPITLGQAIIYGGVTLSNSVTGTGSMALSIAPTFTGTTTVATLAATTINGFTLGGTIAGGGNQLNNIIIGTSTPLAGSFTSLAYSTTLTGTSTNSSALAVGRQGATNPVLQVDASTATVATGLKIKGAAAAGGLALSVITSGTNENLTLDAAGSGTITVGGTSTGAITLTRATTMSAALTYGGVTLSNAVTGTGNMVLSTSPTLVTPTLGAASATSLTATAGISSSGATSGIGYATGAGGAITQITSRTTAVTLNTVSGAITLVSAAGSGTFATFSVNNSAVAATDSIICHQKSGTDKYQTVISRVAAGVFDVSFYDATGTTVEQPVFNFVVIKGVAS